MTHRYGRTYVSAQSEILDALQAAGWSVKRNLKVPHATSPDGNLRLWFKAQAVHYTTSRTGHQVGYAHTIGYDFDIREYTGPSFVAFIEELRT